MKLTLKTEYAFLALLYLARNGNEHKSVSLIAKAQSIPKYFLEQILLELKKTNIVISIKGKSGGFKLNKPPDQITIAEIIRLFDGPLAATMSASKFFYKSSPIEKEKKALDLFKEIRDYLASILEKTTLKELI
ncbi:MAG: putative HTH-type transcriptional regulator [Candidatus Anoxychlamydiales bacterium]|nr:putative HTH-type transcriptional regulator [Candidatus Anoxychlamydiales bacterium]